jgi:hypothetical protein
MLALAMLTATAFMSVSPASAVTIGPTTTCNNALGNGGAVCETTVVNTITPTGGSAVVTVRECVGSAGVPDATCTNTTTPLSAPVTSVEQCNGSINGGGGTLLCSVTITNNYVGMTSAPNPVTINQCVGSVTTGTVRACNPDPATTSDATITQCNGSGNGGGASLTCTATGTQSAALSVLINQCNGSSNGGGTRTVCSSTITNNDIAGAPTATPSASPGPSSGASTPTTGTPLTLVPNTSVGTGIGAASGTLVALGAALIALFGALSALRRRLG